MDPDFARSLIADQEKYLSLFNKKLVNTIVESNPQTSWCCSAKCQALIWVDDRTQAKEYKNSFLNTDICRELESFQSPQEKRSKKSTEQGKSSKPGLMQKVLDKATGSSSSSKSSTSHRLDSRKIATQPIFNPAKLKIDCSECNSDVCFNCGKNWHDPITCEYLAKWDKKCIDDSETTLWLSINTKPCPKCHVNIEKNQGCNHMSCRSGNCKHEFCWICLEDWSKHGTSWFKCDLISKKDKDENAERMMEENKRTMDKYKNCYTRYDAHAKSLKFEIETQKKIQEKMESLEKRLGLTCIETRFLETAARTLTNCRRTLMYCYVFYYYLVVDSVKDHNAHIFSDNLNDLHVQTENLSNALEKITAVDHRNVSTVGKGHTMFNKKSKKVTKEESNALRKQKLRELSEKASGSSSQPSSSYSDHHASAYGYGEGEKMSAEEIQERIGQFKQSKVEILNQDRYCMTRRLQLISHVQEGYKMDDTGTGGYWSFYE